MSTANNPDNNLSPPGSLASLATLAAGPNALETLLAMYLRPLMVATDLNQACRRIEDWILNAEGDDFTLLLDALQVEVHAEKGRGVLKGMIPEYAPRESHANVRTMVSKT